MRIAVTYDNGQIFQHFGRTEAFKVYEVENGEIIKAKIVDSNGSGHGALAGLLSEAGIEVLICGGIGAEHEVLLVSLCVARFVIGDADIPVVPVFRA